MTHFLILFFHFLALGDFGRTPTAPKRRLHGTFYFTDRLISGFNHVHGNHDLFLVVFGGVDVHVKVSIVPNTVERWFVHSRYTLFVRRLCCHAVLPWSLEGMSFLYSPRKRNRMLIFDLEMLQCNQCNGLVVQPEQRFQYFSQYSRDLSCPTCTSHQHHFVKPLPNVFQLFRSNDHVIKSPPTI